MTKKRLATLFLPTVVVALASILPGCPLAGGALVFFPDAALESAVRVAAGKPLGYLTRADVQSITELNASGLNIKTIDGIEELRNLTLLDLRSNDIRSLTPLENLVNLRVLDLGDNNISEIHSISGLFLLEELILWGDRTDIVNWDPLVANAANGGLGDGTIVVLPINSTLDEDESILPYFQEDYQLLINLGTTVLFGELRTSANTGSTP